MITLYSTGTVTFTNGSADIVGVGTGWGSMVDGDLMLAPDGRTYELVFADATHASLDRTYEGSTAAGASYQILKTSTARDTRTLSGQLTDIAQKLLGVLSFTGADKTMTLARQVDEADSGVYLRSTSADKFRIGLFGDNTFRIQRVDDAIWVDVMTVDPDTGLIDLDLGDTNDIELAVVAAEAARDAAIAAKDTAVSAAADAAADQATVAADKATVAADKATVAADKATVAADKGTVAADKATTEAARDDAEDARDAAIAAAASLTQAVSLIADWAANSGAFPAIGGIKKGWMWKVSVAGTMDGKEFGVDDSLIALVDSPSSTTYAANWLKIEGGTISASQIAAALGFTAADAAEVVKLTGDQSVGGVKTFTSIPVLPASNPTTDNQAVRKKYADDALALKANTSSLSIIGTSGSASDLVGGTVPASRMPALTGDVTTVAGAVASTIAAGAVTYAKMAAAALGTAAADFWANTASKVLTAASVWLAAAPVTIADSTTITPNMSTFINGKITLGGNRTLANPTNQKIGQSGFINLIQDATGGRTLAYGTVWKWAGGTAPVLTTTANARDVLHYEVLDTNIILGVVVLDVK